MNADITTDFYSVKLKENKRASVVLERWKEIVSPPVPLVAVALRNMSGINIWRKKFSAVTNQQYT